MPLSRFEECWPLPTESLLKPQHSNNNPNPLANQLWCIDFLYSSHTSHHPSQTPCFPWISHATQKLMPDSCKMVEKQSEAFHTFLWHFFPRLKHNFIAYRSSKVLDQETTTILNAHTQLNLETYRVPLVYKKCEILLVKKRRLCVVVTVVRNDYGDTSSNPDVNCVSHRANIIGRGMNPIILSPGMG